MMDFNDGDDFFESQLKEQLEKKQKKMAKMERLSRKKSLIEEIKSTIDEVKYKEKSSPKSPAFAFKKGSVEWALCILGLSHFSSLAETKKNYLRLAQEYHPDKKNGEDTQQMQDLNEAWELIKIVYR